MCIVCGVAMMPCAIEAWIAHGSDIRPGRMKRDVVPRPERLRMLSFAVRPAPFYGQRQGEAGVEDVMSTLC
jgi:hypothetical protein